MDLIKGQKPAVSTGGLHPADKLKEKDKKTAPGINCGNMREPIPHFVNADCETIIPGKNNSYIVLGRDRPASIHSGYGGAGLTQCGMIDIVVGRMNPEPMEQFNYENSGPSPIMVDPMLVPYEAALPEEEPVRWSTDAARIYISQMTDIDKNFNLPKGIVGNSEAKSGVGIKADAVRIMGNRGIKLIANPDKVDSYGQSVVTCGIDLITMHPDRPILYDTVREKRGKRDILKRGASIQPLVKGTNLQACLQEVLYEIQMIVSTNKKFLNHVVDVIKHYGSHGHSPAVPYQPVLSNGSNLNKALDCNNSLGTTVLQSYASHIGNLRLLENKYLTGINEACYINSKYNNTN